MFLGLLFLTACLSGAAKLARSQRGDKKCGPRECGRKLEHRVDRSQRDEGAVVDSAHFFLLFSFYRILTSSGRGASAVKIKALRATEIGRFLA